MALIDLLQDSELKQQAIEAKQKLGKWEYLMHETEGMLQYLKSGERTDAYEWIARYIIKKAGEVDDR